jgi:hypothetical protein
MASWDTRIRRTEKVLLWLVQHVRRLEAEERKMANEVNDLDAAVADLEAAEEETRAEVTNAIDSLHRELADLRASLPVSSQPLIDRIKAVADHLRELDQMTTGNGTPAPAGMVSQTPTAPGEAAPAPVPAAPDGTLPTPAPAPEAPATEASGVVAPATTDDATAPAAVPAPDTEAPAPTDDATAPAAVPVDPTAATLTPEPSPAPTAPFPVTGGENTTDATPPGDAPVEMGQDASTGTGASNTADTTMAAPTLTEETPAPNPAP